MINYQKTRFTKTDNSNVMSGVMIHDEGLALAASREDGELVVEPSKGASGEIFAGFSYERTKRPTVLGAVVKETVTTEVLASGLLLARLPIAGQIGVFIDGTKVAVDVGTDSSAPGAATAVSLYKGVLYFHADHADKAVMAQYRYEPSLEEARTYGEGNEYNQTPASYEVGVTGRIVGGTVSTTCWDPSVDWSDESKMHPSLGADGLLTIGGSGTVLKNLLIRNEPGQGSPYLTVEFIL